MSDPKKPEDIIELEDRGKSAPVRSGGDRRAINFYQYYTPEELKNISPDRRQEDRREQTNPNETAKKSADVSSGQKP